MYRDCIHGNLAETQKEIEIAEIRLAEETKRYENELKVISKEQAKQHRKKDFQRHNAVQSGFGGEIVIEKSFSQMSEAEKLQVLEYINENARKFRTRLNRLIKTKNHYKLDLVQTVKKACATGGVPLRLAYQKPSLKKTNLILFLDVSGSCRNASELMLVFMHTMKSVFPGGCHTFAFTNRLYDISSFFDSTDAGAAVVNILNSIPRAGAYSNYETSFKKFYQDHMAKVNKDSYVYFIGDARNNKNPTGVDYIKEIARKAKKAYWLNTEEIKKWDTGDSVIGIYAPFMNRVVEMRTPAQLIQFLTLTK